MHFDGAEYIVPGLSALAVFLMTWGSFKTWKGVVDKRLDGIDRRLESQDREADLFREEMRQTCTRILEKLSALDERTKDKRWGTTPPTPPPWTSKK